MPIRHPNAGSTTRSKLSRYAVVTAIATPTNLVLYTVLLRVTSWPALICNLVAATLVTLPTFAANRQWVWRRDSLDSKPAELVRYWLFTVVNVAVASLVVVALEANDAPQWALTLAPLGAYTAMWIARFAYLDRMLFRPETSYPL